MNEIYTQHWDCHKQQITEFKDCFSEWYFFSITPCPTSDEIAEVISAIHNGGDILFEDKKLTIDENDKTNLIKIPELVKKIESKITRQEFKVAVCIGKGLEMINAQPIVICFDPLISYSTFPNHPHLNGPVINNKGILPPTLCYTNAPDKLGEMFEDKLLDTMFYVSNWLFRHQIWQLVYENFKESLWIGAGEAASIPDSEFPNFINPKNRCRCGSHAKYSDCCLSSDLGIEKISKDYEQQKFTKWLNQFMKPEMGFVKLLKKYDEKKKQGL